MNYVLTIFWKAEAENNWHDEMVRILLG